METPDYQSKQTMVQQTQHSAEDQMSATINIQSKFNVFSPKAIQSRMPGNWMARSWCEFLLKWAECQTLSSGACYLGGGVPPLAMTTALDEFCLPAHHYLQFQGSLITHWPEQEIMLLPPPLNVSLASRIHLEVNDPMKIFMQESMKTSGQLMKMFSYWCWRLPWNHSWDGSTVTLMPQWSSKPHLAPVQHGLTEHRLSGNQLATKLSGGTLWNTTSLCCRQTLLARLRSTWHTTWWWSVISLLPDCLVHINFHKLYVLLQQDSGYFQRQIYILYLIRWLI